MLFSESIDMLDSIVKIRHFKSASDFRHWLEVNHSRVSELWVGYRKKHTGEPSVTWPESVDEALGVGWIDFSVSRSPICATSIDVSAALTYKNSTRFAISLGSSISQISSSARIISPIDRAFA